jgi:hypothetical protein
MPDLSFSVEGADPVAFAAAPLLALKLRVTNADEDEAVHSVMLQCQVRLDVAHRRYTPTEQDHLADLFGPPHRWGQTLRSLLWARVIALVPPFTGTTTVDLHVPCTFDFNIATTKYFHGLNGGDVPLSLLFSGTIFFAPADSADGALQVAQLPWDKEATARLPVQVWKEMMERYYPNTAWLCLRRDVFDRLYRYKSDHSLPTWEQALEDLLRTAEQGVTP